MKKIFNTISVMSNRFKILKLQLSYLITMNISFQTEKKIGADSIKFIRHK